jgi:WD40 repeat protein
MCVMVSLALVQLFPENADIVDLVLRHYYHGASGWDTARFDSGIRSVQYGPAGDVIAAGDSDGRIHLICTQTGAKILCADVSREWAIALGHAQNGTRPTLQEAAQMLQARSDSASSASTVPAPEQSDAVRGTLLAGLQLKTLEGHR